jgi:hypothetical protein
MTMSITPHLNIIHTQFQPSGNLHYYFPENLYLSSVLPTRTLQELQYFQDHCWKQFKNPQQPCFHFVFGLDESHQLPPVHFTFKTSFGDMQQSFMMVVYLRNTVELNKIDKLNDPTTHILNQLTLSTILG